MNVYTIADDLGKASSAKKKARRAKAKKGGQKFGRALALVTLAIPRGAFLSFVALNIGGLATRLKKLQTLKRFGKVAQLWKKLGGLQKVFDKAINTGAKKKPVFISKKARAKFNTKMKGMSGLGRYNWQTFERVADNTINDEIAAAPAIPVIVAAASAILAGIIPIIKKEFAAAGMKKEAQEAGQFEEENKETLQQEIKTQQADENRAQAQEVSEEEEVEVSEEESMDGLYGPEETANLITTLGSAGASLVGLIGKAVKRKAKKKGGKKFANTLIKISEKAPGEAEAYFTGKYLQKTGAIDAARNFQTGAGKYGIWIGVAGAVAVVGALFLSKKK
jgi:hypothetical protein